LEKNKTESWNEYKKSIQNAKRIICSAKEKKQKECASDLNDPNHTHTQTHTHARNTHTTVLRLCGFCPGQPG